jgi:hypothetical protein
MKSLAIRGMVMGGLHGLVLSVMYTLLLGLLYAILSVTNNQADGPLVAMISLFVLNIGIVFLFAAIIAYLPASALVIGAIAGFLISILYARQTRPLSEGKAVLRGIVSGSAPGLVLIWLVAKRLNLITSLANANAVSLMLFVIIPGLLYFWSLVRVSLALNRSLAASEQAERKPCQA